MEVGGQEAPGGYQKPGPKGSGSRQGPASCHIVPPVTARDPPQLCEESWPVSPQLKAFSQAHDRQDLNKLSFSPHFPPSTLVLQQQTPWPSFTSKDTTLWSSLDQRCSGRRALPGSNPALSLC